MSKANSNKPVSTAKTYNFCGKRKMIAIITALVIIVAAVGIIVRGLKVAI